MIFLEQNPSGKNKQPFMRTKELCSTLSHKQERKATVNVKEPSLQNQCTNREAQTPAFLVLGWLPSGTQVQGSWVAPQMGTSELPFASSRTLEVWPLHFSGHWTEILLKDYILLPGGLILHQSPNGCIKDSLPPFLNPKCPVYNETAEEVFWWTWKLAYCYVSLSWF